MSGPHSDDAAALPTAPERRPRVEALPREVLATLDMPPPGWPIAHGDPGEVSAVDGLESQVLLARARQRLLGWDDMPVTVGRYRVLERIGQGGMGVVYAAHDDELDRDVAIKILRSELAPGTAGRQRLVREAQATAKLSHPNVVHVYEVGQQGEQVFMAMELVRGRTLRAWTKARRRTWQEIVAMFVQAGEGLVAAHEHGIVHRDFKPDNVLIGKDANARERPRVVDFGLARGSAELTTGEHPVFRDVEITCTGTVIGTPAYMAPEQLARAEPDARSDQFSFCVALFEALYRHRPFAGSTYTQIADSLTAGVILLGDRGEVPAHLHSIVMRGLSRNPDDRHPSMRALLDRLALATRTRPRRRWVAATLLAVVGGTAIGAIALRPTQEASATAAEPAALAPDPWADVVAATPLPPVIDTPLPDDPAQMSVQRLRNGLTIYVAHRPLEPMIALGLAVRAGQQEQGEHGAAIPGLVISSLLDGTARVGTTDEEAERPQRELQHALIETLPQIREPAAREIMLQTIAASERNSAGFAIGSELFDAAVALGGRGSIVLDRHGVLFAVKQPAHRVKAWLELIAEAVQRPAFRGFLGATAERLDFVAGFGADRPGTAAQYRALAAATGIHRDRELAIADLLEVPLADARAFHRSHYRPNNAALIFIGDITPAQAVALAEQTFGDWEPAPIPATPTIDEPLPSTRTLIETEAPGPYLVTLSWPMPPLGTPEHAELEVLVHALDGRVGLLDATLDGRAHGWAAYLGDARDLHVMAMPRKGDTLETTEQTLLAALDSIAQDRLPDRAWEGALAEAQLSRLRWARGPAELLWTAGQSFFAHQSWATTAATIGSDPPTRAQIVGAARRLLARNHIVTYERPGKLTLPVAPDLPDPPVPGRSRARSRFVEALLASPAPQIEPRFLVEGSHFTRGSHGAGRIVTTESDSPLFWLTWVHPIGAAEDPWACDATRARVRSLSVVGAEVMVFCSAADTRVRVVGPSARFDEMLPSLVRWLEGADYPELELRDYATHVIENRRSNRAQPFLRTMWSDFSALLGSRAIDPLLPSDAELLARAHLAIPASRAAILAYDPDVLYVGPHTDRLRAALPAPRGRGSDGPPIRAYRVRERPEIVVMHDPDHDRVSVRASMPWLATTPTEQLAAQIHESLVFDHEYFSRFEPDYDHLGYETAWNLGPSLAIGIGFRVDAEQTVEALVAARDALRQRPSREEFAHTHDLLETSFRAQRWAPRHVPELVYEWGTDGADPRVAQWLALPGLRYDDLLRYHERVDATIPALVVVGDLTTIDLGELAKIGEIVRVDPDVVIRETSMAAYGRELGAMMDH